MTLRKLFLLMLLISLVAPLVATPTQTVRSDSNVIPPQVIDVYPFPGSELSGNEPLTISFNQVMNRSSVEDALTFAPHIEGELTWSDSRTVLFTPTISWGIDITYEITITTQAQSEVGVALEFPYQTVVVGLTALEVADVTPANGTRNVAADSSIFVSFNKPVVPLVSTHEMADLPDPLVIKPAIEGTGEWINTALYRFTPTGWWQADQTYTVRVPANFTATDGAYLTEDFVSRFHVKRPSVVSVTPDRYDVLLDETLFVEFDQPMDKISVERAFSLTLTYDSDEVVAGEFIWSEDATSFEFIPTPPLEIETFYMINLADTATDIHNLATMVDNYTGGFRTIPLPGISYTYPKNNEENARYRYNDIQINFKSPMNMATLAGKIEISPSTDFIPVVKYESQLSIDLDLQPSTEYIVTIKAGAEDIYGNAIPEDDSFSFHTADIPNEISISNYNMMVTTGSYRENTSVAVTVSGNVTGKFKLYVVPTDEWINNAQNAFEDTREYYETGIPEFERDDNLIRAWSQSFDSNDQEDNVQELALTTPEEGSLPLGVYWLIMENTQPDIYDNTPTTYKALVVANINIAVKRVGNGKSLVWLTDMQTGQPVVDLPILVYQNGTIIATGISDENGVVEVQLPIVEDSQNYYSWTDTDLLWIETVSHDKFGAWYSNRGYSAPDHENYVRTDRRLYRPGETVYFWGVARQRDDMTYALPNESRVHITIGTYGTHNSLFDSYVRVTEAGTFSGELVLPDDVSLEEIYISVNDYREYTFEIAEFRVPEYEVRIESESTEIFAGDTLNATLTTRYYSGEVLNDAYIGWYAQAYPAEFEYTGVGNYSFYSDEWQYFSPYYLYDEGENLKTDANGQSIIATDDTLPPTPRPIDIWVGASVHDNGYTISNHTIVRVHPTDLYVGLKSDRYFGDIEDARTVSGIVVDTESNPIANHSVNVTVQKVNWTQVADETQFGEYDWEVEYETLQVENLITDANGQITTSFVPETAGSYRVIITSQDSQGRSLRASLRIWSVARTSYRLNPAENISMTPDQDTYQVGDTARIIIPLDVDAPTTVLVTIERAGILNYEILQVADAMLIYELPITEDYISGIYVSALIVGGVTADRNHPFYATDEVYLQVIPNERRLHIDLQVSNQQAQPSETVDFEVLITDIDGEPVEATLNLILTDKAIRDLLPEPTSNDTINYYRSIPVARTASLEDSFYGSQDLDVFSTTSLSTVIDKHVDEARTNPNNGTSFNWRYRRADSADQTGRRLIERPLGGALYQLTSLPLDLRNQIEMDIRDDFQQTPLWEAELITDASGQATISVSLPDNLTTWVLEASAVTVETHIGTAELEIKTALPLTIRPATPRFFVVGDYVQLAAIVANNTNEIETIEVLLEAKGVSLESEIIQSITLQPQTRQRVNWWVTVEDVSFVDLVFIAIGERNQDAARPSLTTGPDNTIPVYHYTAPDTVATSGLLPTIGSRTEVISLPTRILDQEQGEILLEITPSLAGPTTESLTYLREYRHECIEQTINRFLPNIVYYRALRSLDIDDPELAENLQTVLDKAHAKLQSAQLDNGGWGWFSGDRDVNRQVTAYAVFGLIQAQDAGYTIDEEILERGLDYLESQEAFSRSSQYSLNWLSFYYFVMAQARPVDTAQLELLFDKRADLSYQGRAYLLMTYHQLDPTHSYIALLENELINDAIFSATGVHWEEEHVDWLNWTSDTRSTALILSAFLKVNPESNLLPSIVRWLMIAREEDHWKTSQETVWSLLALTDWMLYTNELNGDFDYQVSLNGDMVFEDTVTASNVRDVYQVNIPLNQLILDDLNQLEFTRNDGAGALYYTSYLKMRLFAEDVGATVKGILVQREYFVDGKSVASAHVGELITVRVSFILSQDVHYFVLEAPIPAGTEMVNTRLGTSSGQATSPQISTDLDFGYYWWYWGWRLFDHQELRDEQANVYADYLPKGSYTFSYQVQAITPGEFQVLPAYAYGFYYPEVFGHSDGNIFPIEE